MISRSRRKHRTTAPTWGWARRLSLACCLVGCPSFAAHAQFPQPQVGGVSTGSDSSAWSTPSTASGHSTQHASLRPVPKERTRLAASENAQVEPRRDGWNLTWRTSPNLQNREPESPPATTPRDREPTATIGGTGPSLSTLAPQATRVASPIANPLREVRSDSLQTSARSPEHPGATARSVARVNYFEDPFAETTNEPPQRSGVATDIATAHGGSPTGGPSFGQLIRASAQSVESLPAPAETHPTQSNEASNEWFNDGSADWETTLISPQPIPQDRDGSVESLFLPPPSVLPPPSLDATLADDPQTSPSDMPGRREGELNARQDEPQLIPRSPFQREDAGALRFLDEPTIAGLSCDDFRQKIRERTILQVSLDISPPFRPDILDQAEYERAKAEFEDRQPIRTWRTADGRELGTGRLRDLAYEKAVIETAYGSVEELPVNRLSEADLAFISENWGVPTECLIEQVEYTPRNWNPTTVTWMASNLYHYPLYFEEVNLERYGHTAGPILQPVVSSAHFFANIAVLPYKMGIHAPNECQYALGYYRPGNCAPWILPPVPLSLRGGLTQAASMTGAILLIP